MPCASDRSIGSLPPADSDSLVFVELDNSRISNRISASRSGGSGDTLINVIDAADLKFCLLLRSFWYRRRESASFASYQTIPCAREGTEFCQCEGRQAADSAMSFRMLPNNPLNRLHFPPNFF